MGTTSCRGRGARGRRRRCRRSAHLGRTRRPRGRRALFATMPGPPDCPERAAPRSGPPEFVRNDDEGRPHRTPTPQTAAPPADRPPGDPLAADPPRRPSRRLQARRLRRPQFAAAQVPAQRALYDLATWGLGRWSHDLSKRAAGPGRMRFPGLTRVHHSSGLGSWCRGAAPGEVGSCTAAPPARWGLTLNGER